MVTSRHLLCVGKLEDYIEKNLQEVKAQISPPNRKANENSGRSKVGKAFEHRFGMFGVGVFRKGLGGEVALESKPKPFNFQIC